MSYWWFDTKTSRAIRARGTSYTTWASGLQSGPSEEELCGTASRASVMPHEATGLWGLYSRSRYSRLTLGPCPRARRQLCSVVRPFQRLRVRPARSPPRRPPNSRARRRRHWRNPRRKIRTTRNGRLGALRWRHPSCNGRSRKSYGKTHGRLIRSCSPRLRHPNSTGTTTTGTTSKRPLLCMSW